MFLIMDNRQYSIKDIPLLVSGKVFHILKIYTSHSIDESVEN